MIILKRTALALTVFINISPMMATFPDYPHTMHGACCEKIEQIHKQVTLSEENARLLAPHETLRILESSGETRDKRDETALHKKIKADLAKSLYENIELIEDFVQEGLTAQVNHCIACIERQEYNNHHSAQHILEPVRKRAQYAKDTLQSAQDLVQFLQKQENAAKTVLLHSAAKQLKARAADIQQLSAQATGEIEAQERALLEDQESTVRPLFNDVWKALKDVRHYTTASARAETAAAAAQARLQTVQSEAKAISQEARVEAAPIAAAATRSLWRKAWDMLQWVYRFATGTAPALETAPVACRAATARTAVLAATEARLAKAAAEKAAQAKLAAEAHLVATIAAATPQADAAATEAPNLHSEKQTATAAERRSFTQADFPRKLLELLRVPEQDAGSR